MPQLLKFASKSDRAFQIRAKSATTAEIIIYSAIGPANWFEETVSAKSFSEELGKLDKSVNLINVRINSGGGDVFDGLTIYNRLKQHKAKVVVYIDGLAASIASIIALAGDEIVMGDGSLMMIHKPWTFAGGNSTDLEAVVDRLYDVEEQLVTVYQKRTGLERAEIKKMLAEETWLDADQAISMKFADKKSEDSLPIAASVFKSPWINHAPTNYKSQTKVVGDSILELKKKIEAKLARK